MVVKSMEFSSSKQLLRISAFFLSASIVASISIQPEFLRCLSHHSQPSKPISEAIYTPNNSSFSYILNFYIRNLRYMTPSTPKPVVIIAAMDESHIQATVICSKLHNLEVRIRSGGHDYEGLSYISYVPFVILDMFNLRAIDVDISSEVAWVESGATVGELYYRIAEKSDVHGFPAGVCPTVGVGGHFGGGGYGNMIRKYGLTVDNVVDAKVVNVNGEILDRKSMGEDLFWAIRGGGAESFGVVVSWKVKLVKVPPIVTFFELNKTLEQGATEIVYQWQKVAYKLHEDVFIRAKPKVVNKTDESGKTIKVYFLGLFLGQVKELLPMMNESFPELGLEEKDCIESSWIESTVLYSGFPNGTSIDVLLNRTSELIYFKSKSDYVKNPLEKTDFESIWRMMIELENIAMEWNPYGGRMNEIGEAETPFPHRAGNMFKIFYIVFWDQEGIETANDYMNRTTKFYNAMAPFVSKYPREAFLNYRDLDIGKSSTNYTNARVYGAKYFKKNFDRLVQVKTMVDPENFFKSEQSIPTLPYLDYERGDIYDE